MTLNLFKSILNYRSEYDIQKQEFTEWRKSASNNSLFLKLLEEGAKESKDGTDTWGRIVCQWNEKIPGKILKHEYIARVDVSTGDIYFDCSTKKAYLKSLVHTFTCPIYTAALMCLEIVGAILFTPIESIFLKRSFKEFVALEWTHIKNGCVRMPLYGLAMTISTLVSTVAFPLVRLFSKKAAENLLFNSTFHAGRLNTFLFNGKNHYSKPGGNRLWHGIKYFDSIVICFKPVANIKYCSHDLSNVGQKTINCWRNKRFFWNGYKKLSPTEAYVSPCKKTVKNQGE